MFEYKTEQKEYTIGKVKIGGIPGKNPTVMIGTIFYHKHSIIQDDKKGIFDKERAEELIKMQEEMSDTTGLPGMIDVVGTTPEGMTKELEFVANVTDMPILVDSPAAQVKLAGMKYAKEIGFWDRAIYNSILPETKKEELDAMKELGIENVILLTFVTDFTTTARMRAVEKLIEMAEYVGAKKLLVDTAVIDVPSLGVSLYVIHQIKDQYGLPVGCGAHNAVDTWKGLKKKYGDEAIKPAIAATNTAPVIAGADFVLYGPIESAKVVFPAVAMVNAAYGYVLGEKEMMVKPPHPLFKIA